MRYKHPRNETLSEKYRTGGFYVGGQLDAMFFSVLFFTGFFDLKTPSGVQVPHGWAHEGAAENTKVG